MMKVHVDDRKVLVYARRGSQLLVFLEPDHPEVHLQVPGGTIEADETAAQAARREFAEETGLPAGRLLRNIGEHEYSYDVDGRTIRHQRHGFAFDVEAGAAWPDDWLHRELHPSQGSPMLFHFFWVEIGNARGRLGYGMELFLDHAFFQLR